MLQQTMIWNQDVNAVSIAIFVIFTKKEDPRLLVSAISADFFVSNMKWLKFVIIKMSSFIINGDNIQKYDINISMRFSFFLISILPG